MMLPLPTPPYLCVALLSLVWVSQVRAEIQLLDRGYEGLVVAVSASVPQDDSLLGAIKKAVKEMSESLYRASKRSLFFRNVTILLPESWNTESSVDVYNATVEHDRDAMIRIEPSNPVYGYQPYTVQAGGCGEEGRYLHLTPTYLKNSGKACAWGPTGKTLAREWAKLRWGVFDELGFPNDPIFPLFFWRDQAEGSGSDQKNVIQPNYCTNQPLSGKFIDPTTEIPCMLDKDTMGLDANCRFVPKFLQNATASLMSQHYISSIDSWCDSGEEGKMDHDSSAPNKHNLICGGESVWKVIKRHSDFKDIKEVTELEPVFRVVKTNPAKYVLLFDTTKGVLEGGLSKAKEAAKIFILHQLHENSRVGIFRFGEITKGIKGLTQVNTTSTRKDLADGLDQLTELGKPTCYVCALNRAMDLVKGHNNSVILIITDDAKPYATYDSVKTQNKVKDKNITVFSLIYANKTNTMMESMATKTGGKVFYNRTQDAAQKFFQHALLAQPIEAPKKSRALIHEAEYAGKTRKTFNSSFYVDTRLNRRLRFRFWTNVSSQITAEPYLLNPSKERVETKKAEFDDKHWMFEVDEAEVGEWSWEVGMQLARLTWVSADVSATPNPDKPPIILQAWLNTSSELQDAKTQATSVHASVLQGNSPVLRAQVRLIVTLPSNETYNLTLLDSGCGTDMLQGDGIYSRLLTNITTKGIHSFQVMVWGDSNTTFKLDNSYRLSADIRSPVAAESCSSKPSSGDPPTYCCGSSIPTSPSYERKTGNFTRLENMGNFNITSIPVKESSDKIGPSRVLDLHVWVINKDALGLKWSAAGDDFDQGAAAKYEIYKTTRLSDLSSHLGKISTVDFPDSNSIQIPPAFGMMANKTLNLTDSIDYNTLYYVALSAVDDANNKSPLSNVARILIQEFVEPPPVKIPTMAYVIMGASVITIGFCVIG